MWTLVPLALVFLSLWGMYLENIPHPSPSHSPNSFSDTSSRFPWSPELHGVCPAYGSSWCQIIAFGVSDAWFRGHPAWTHRAALQAFPCELWRMNRPLRITAKIRTPSDDPSFFLSLGGEIPIWNSCSVLLNVPQTHLKVFNSILQRILSRVYICYCKRVSHFLQWCCSEKLVELGAQEGGELVTEGQLC